MQKKILSKYTLFIISALLLTFSACDKNNNLVLFSIENDKELGMQVSQQIAADPTFNLLTEGENPDAYTYINNMVNEIINSGEVAYRDEFVWEVSLIDNDTVLNAFATPGGYIYVYTGLIKYLETADALEGVLGHEIAHADLRHTSRNLQKQYGVSILLSIILGESPSELEQIAGQIAGTIAGLSFSREYESEADERSVEYLAQTQYACNGAAFFFESLLEENQSSPPEFLSTHPSPENRVGDINAKAEADGCDTSLATDTGYEAMKASL
ncbi:MAG: M48 family metalloprotease [Fulvivirga sp.]